jgi:hypothetical protein
MHVLVSDFELTATVGVKICAQVVSVLVWACDMRGTHLHDRIATIIHKIDSAVSLSVKLDQSHQ